MIPNFYIYWSLTQCFWKLNLAKGIVNNVDFDSYRVQLDRKEDIILLEKENSPLALLMGLVKYLNLNLIDSLIFLKSSMKDLEI
jgi:hypothetical protein